MKSEKGRVSGVEAQKSKLHRVGKGEGPSGQRALWSSDLKSTDVRASFKKEVESPEEETRSTFHESDSSTHVYYVLSSLLGSGKDIKEEA